MMELKEKDDNKPIIRINESILINNEYIEESCNKYKRTDMDFSELTEDILLSAAANAADYTKWCKMDDGKFCNVHEFKASRTNLDDAAFCFATYNGSNESLQDIIKSCNKNSRFEYGKYKVFPIKDKGITYLYGKIEELYRYVKEPDDAITESLTSMNNLFHLSQSNLDGKTLTPRIPSNYFTKNGYEDGKTARVCFAKNIDMCLRALSQKCEGMKLYVHIPDENYNTYTPTTKQVPDCKITSEVWVKEPVKLKCIGQIEIIKDRGEDGIPYKYGNNIAELYDWDWKWIKKFNNSIQQEACKDLMSARKLCNDVRKVAKKYNANFFFVTDGASAYSNGNGKSDQAVKAMRTEMDKWEEENGFNPEDDWGNNIKDTTNYKKYKNSMENTIMYNEETRIEDSKIPENIYHISTVNHNGETFEPRYYDNDNVKKDMERRVKRVCFSDSINGALYSIFPNGAYDIDLYVHIPGNKVKVYSTTSDDIYDSDITHELWVKEPVDMKCIGKIHVSGVSNKSHTLEVDKDKSGYGKRKYYEPRWNWVEKYDKEITKESAKPAKCSKCGSSNIGVYIQGEPIYKCNDCGEYLGVVDFPNKKS